MKKKKFLSLICMMLFVIGVTGCGKEKINNSSNNSANNSKEITYYDDTRDIKDTYTFKEAISKFAFKVNETTLIFEENDKINFEMAMAEQTVYDELWPTEFEYKQNIYTSLGVMELGESNSKSLTEFTNNFNKGILSDKRFWNVEDVKIIESNDEYVFASWINRTHTTSYEYYFAKKIGNVIYYAYHVTLLQCNDTKISLLLNQFKEFFTCLKEDDGKEPYIYDKIMNIPLALNKQIKDVNSIHSIINGKGNKIDGLISFSTDNSDFVNLEYGAKGHYDKIDWGKTFDSKIKYTKEDDKNIIGIKDGNITQIFEITINSDQKINNSKDFNNYISKYLIDK